MKLSVSGKSEGKNQFCLNFLWRGSGECEGQAAEGPVCRRSGLLDIFL